MPLRDMATPGDHTLCPVPPGQRTGCDFCSRPAVQEWSAPNGSYGHYCERHRHHYGTYRGVQVLLPDEKQEKHP